jgi:hypothetical protein
VFQPFRTWLIARLNAPARTDGRWWVLGLLLAYFSILVLSQVLYGDFAVAWKRLGVFSQRPLFADLRAITGGWDCIRLGHDPMRYNPCAPWGVAMNYPRIWQWLVVLGLGETHTIPIGVGLGVLFFGTTVFLLAGRMNRAEAVVYGLLLISPAIMFGVDRGNNDLFIYVLLVLAGHLLTRPGLRSWAGEGLFLLAMVLKVYPIFGILHVLRADRRQTFIRTAGVLAAFVVFIALIAKDLPYMSGGTHRPTQNAFGLFVFADELARRIGHGSTLRLAALVGTALVLLGAAWRAWGHAGTFRHAFDRSHFLYTLGAGVYCGIFLLLGNSYDYRMVFLLLTIPQVLAWICQPGRLQTPALLYLLALLLTLWTRVWRLPLWELVPAAQAETVKNAEYALVFVLEEGLNLYLLAFHAYALLLILTYWVRQSTPTLAARLRLATPS